ncbi:hypothetical protein OG874_31325 [Nocardia sp. NBC_00565]|uniref:hypothetical protein n=1 Tax=Nocardia sp. NBC_00565 TaxID=2975993 RepID=UPI002E7FD30A|nr:hypothetical protein [Nocardia sp. NBC_00565]WUC01268.1 hypothetical protein OG874_31325 [Nocardia sp. NBC_00565]
MNGTWEAWGGVILAAFAVLPLAGSLVWWLARRRGERRVEGLQFALGIGRHSSIDDVLVNAIGALVAGLLSHPWWRPAVSAERASCW